MINVQYHSIVISTFCVMEHFWNTMIVNLYELLYFLFFMVFWWFCNFQSKKVQFPKWKILFRFAAIASSSPDAPNLFKRPSTGTQGTSVGASNSGNVANAQAAPAASAVDDSRMDSAAHRALLRNELLSDNIDDIRVCLFCFVRI